MAAGKQPMSERIYQIKMTIKGSTPPIWRRLQVPGNITLHRLHLILQAAMGWTNSRLYRFEIQGTQFSDPATEDEFHGLRVENSHTARLGKLISREKAKFAYEYGSGNSWQHELLIEKLLPAEPDVKYPLYLGGKWACPPEDSGGIWDHSHFLEVIRDSLHKAHKEMLEWLGEQFNPQEVDLQEVDWLLKHYGENDDIANAEPKIARNSLCPCGSGKKYDYCCGKQSKIALSSTGELPTGDWRATQRLIERDLRSIQQAIEKQGFETEEEVNAFLQETTAKGEVPGWVPETLLEQAQEFIYQAWETTDRKKRIHLAIEALESCQDCADAYLVFAEEAAATPHEARYWYQQGVEAGERALGPHLFAEEAGNFWRLLETRPYMRAREGLADCLFSLGERNAAIEHYRDMLRLNPHDNQGIRYKLLNSLMETNNIDGAEELLGQFQDEASTVWLFTASLITFIHQGDSAKARARLKTAIEQNPHVLPYLLEQARLPHTIPEYVSMGDKDEAAAYVTEFVRYWVDAPGALRWLRNVADNDQNLGR